MDQYKTLQQGAGNDPEAVKKLQQTLYDEGYTQVGDIDGIYGPKTAAAVKAYQTKNQLQIDGIAGNETLSHLYREKAPEPQTPEVEVPEVPQVEAPKPVPTPVEQARQELDALRQQGAQVNRAYEEKLQSLYDQIINRPAFSYNINEDALFAQYADQYQRGGVLAMQDAMGQAAALTGGYGSSYGQAVGQQTYQQYMAGLANVIPTLEQNAYSRYRQGHEDLLEQYGLLWQQANDEYGKYMDALQQQWQELDYAQGREDLAWERQQAQQQDAYSRLLSFMSVGYNPTDEELAAAGMTRAQANAIAKDYAASQVRYTGNTTQSLKDYHTIVSNAEEEFLRGGKEGVRLYLDSLVARGFLSQESRDDIYKLATTPGLKGVIDGDSIQFPKVLNPLDAANFIQWHTLT